MSTLSLKRGKKRTPTEKKSRLSVHEIELARLKAEKKCVRFIFTDGSKSSNYIITGFDRYSVQLVEVVYGNPEEVISNTVTIFKHAIRSFMEV